MTIESLYNPEKDKFVRFDAPEEYAAYLEKIPSKYYDSCFYGLSVAQCIEKLYVGDTTNTAKASALIDKMQEEQVFSTGVYNLARAVVGAVPNVPAYLMGHPKTMLRRELTESQSVSTPLNIYVDTSLSAGVSAQQALNRGVAILAFAMAMAMVRPVELFAVYANSIDTSGRGYGIAVKIETKPLDLARATWMLTSDMFPRKIGFTVTRYLSNYTGSSSVPWAWFQSSNDTYEVSMKDAFDLQPDDIFFRGGVIIDRLMLTDPITWVKNELAKHRGDTIES